MPALCTQVSVRGGGGGVVLFLCALGFFLILPHVCHHFWQDVPNIHWSALTHHEPCHCMYQLKARCFDTLCTLLQITPQRCWALAWWRLCGGSLQFTLCDKKQRKHYRHRWTEWSNTVSGTKQHKAADPLLNTWIYHPKRVWVVQCKTETVAGKGQHLN